MIARYLLWRDLGFTREQARALADAGYFVIDWVRLPS